MDIKVFLLNLTDLVEHAATAVDGQKPPDWQSREGFHTGFAVGFSGAHGFCLQAGFLVAGARYPHDSLGFRFDAAGIFPADSPPSLWDML